MATIMEHDVEIPLPIFPTHLHFKAAPQHAEQLMPKFGGNCTSKNIAIFIHMAISFPNHNVCILF